MSESGLKQMMAGIGRKFLLPFQNNPPYDNGYLPTMPSETKM